jgi:hypothetical protein
MPETGNLVSVREQTTDVGPSENRLPEPGVHVTPVGWQRPWLQAAAEYVTIAPPELVASAFLLVGNLSLGTVGKMVPIFAAT